MKFLKNVATLLVMVVGLTCGIGLGGYGLSKAVTEITKVRYEPAVSAAYLYVPGDELCDMMTGAVDLMISRGYKINKVEIPAHVVPEGEQVPVMAFLDSEGNEIAASRMSGLWSLGDVKARFGEVL